MVTVFGSEHTAASFSIQVMLRQKYLMKNYLDKVMAKNRFILKFLIKPGTKKYIENVNTVPILTPKYWIHLKTGLWVLGTKKVKLHDKVQNCGFMTLNWVR